MQEYKTRKGDDYSNLGKSTIEDPLSYCLPGSFFNKPQVAEIGLCRDFMVQRCSQKWDDKCVTYIDGFDKDPVRIRNFFRDITSKKYCRLSEDSNCSIECQNFNPIDGSSEKVCRYIGNETLKDVNEKVDIGMNRDVVVSPDYMGKCMQKCDLSIPESNDVSIDFCLKYGLCNDILDSICYSNIDKLDSIQHVGLKSYCIDYKKDISLSSESVKNSFKSSNVFRNSNGLQDQSGNESLTLSENKKQNDEKIEENKEKNDEENDESKNRLRNIILFILFILILFILMVFIYIRNFQ